MFRDPPFRHGPGAAATPLLVLLLAIPPGARTRAPGTSAGPEAAFQGPVKDTLWIARFSEPSPADALPTGWLPISFGGDRGETEYRAFEVDGSHCLLGETQGGGSGLVRPMAADPAVFPRLRWGWWVNGPVPEGDLFRKEGDDFAARVYVNFRFDPSEAGFLDRIKHRLASRRFGGEAPGRSLVYVWGNREAVGTMSPNAYTDQAVVVVVRSGVAEAGRWWEEERNVLEDFRAAFGEEPPWITSFAIMSDGDDTGGAASACYGDLFLLGQRS